MSSTHSSFLVLAHRVATHFDPMRVMDQAVEDAVSQRRIADLLMPV